MRRSGSNVVVLSCALLACSAAPAPRSDIAPDAPIDGGRPAAPVGVLVLPPCLAAMSVSSSLPDHARNPQRGDLEAGCMPLFFRGADVWIRDRLPQDLRGPWNERCQPLPLENAALLEHPGQTPRERRSDVERRRHHREGAIRALERTAGMVSAIPITSIALGYLLAERAYEEAVAASWRCHFCENFPPNVFVPEAFVASLERSSAFERAIRSFESVSARSDDIGCVGASSRRALAGISAVWTTRRRPRSGAGSREAALAEARRRDRRRDRAGPKGHEALAKAIARKLAH
jgi:hypothetical protein